MNSDPVEVAIIYSRDKGSFSIEFSKCIVNGPTGKRRKKFKVIDFDAKNILSGGDDKAASFLGDTILGLLEQIVEGGIGYNSMNEKRLQVNELMYQRAMKNNVDAQTHVATNYLNTSIEKQDEKLLDLAEEWFQRAADTGDEDSKKFLKETWPKLKGIYLKEIQRRKSDQ